MQGGPSKRLVKTPSLSLTPHVCVHASLIQCAYVCILSVEAALVAAVAYLGVSQACRPVGAAAQMRRTLQFFLAKAVLMTPWSEPSHFAVLPMVVKQAQTAAPELGRGEITSAFGAVENLLSVATPVLWATTYAYFVKGQHSAAVVPLLLGPGGHFILAACLRCLSSLVLSTCDDSLLFLDS